MKNEINTKLAEFIGMHIGDGTLYRTNSNTLVWEQRGNLREKDYYDDHVYPLIRTLFGEVKPPKYRKGGKNGCYGIQTCNRNLVNALLKLGIKPGKKTGIRIPLIIMESKTDIKKAFLRGYFDTDGCIRRDRMKHLKEPYPKIEFATISEPLSKDLNILLQELGLRPYLWEITKKLLTTEFRLCIAGKRKVALWFNEIGSNNPKHLKKFCQS
jgi:intein/homing endonuclease